MWVHRLLLLDLGEGAGNCLETWGTGVRAMSRYPHHVLETADVLGVPVGTVKSRALLGMRRLRQIFAAEMDLVPQAG